MNQEVVIETGTPVVLTRKNARVWLRDSGELDHLESGTTGIVTGQRSLSTVIVNFPDTRWANRPVIVRVAELETL